MNKLLTVIFIAGSLSAMSWGDGLSGSGVKGVREVSLDEFRALEGSGALEIEVHCGQAARARVSGDDNLLDLVQFKQQGERLVLDLSQDISSRSRLLIELWTPTLEELEISGACEVRVLKLNSSSLEIELSGASELVLNGQTGRLELDQSGASELEGHKFIAEVAEVDISGASEATFMVTKSIGGECSGASDLELLGQPAHVNVECSGASSVKGIERRHEGAM
jgi:hypothetical protein